jgi:hypothetical protein
VRPHQRAAPGAAAHDPVQHRTRSSKNLSAVQLLVEGDRTTCTAATLDTAAEGAAAAITHSHVKSRRLRIARKFWTDTSPRSATLTTQRRSSTQAWSNRFSRQQRRRRVINAARSIGQSQRGSTRAWRVTAARNCMSQRAASVCATDVAPQPELQKQAPNR